MNATSRKSTALPRTAFAARELLEHNDALGPLRAGMQQSRALNSDLHKLLPDYLAAHVKASLIKDGTLVVLTEHSALAARLRHLEPALIGQLQQRGWTVQKLRIKIKPLSSALASVPPKPTLSPAALAALRTLLSATDAPPLQEAVRRLLERHRQFG
jgi:hypothetical protein